MSTIKLPKKSIEFFKSKQNKIFKSGNLAEGPWNDELAKKIMSTVGIDVRLVYDKNFPDGTPRKVLDVSKIKKLGWSSSTSLQEGLSKVYNNKFLDK